MKGTIISAKWPCQFVQWPFSRGFLNSGKVLPGQKASPDALEARDNYLHLMSRKEYQ